MARGWRVAAHSIRGMPNRKRTGQESRRRRARLTAGAGWGRDGGAPPAGRRWGVRIVPPCLEESLVIPPVLPTYARAPARLRRGRGGLARSRGRRALPRPRRRHRGHRARARAPGAGRGARGAGEEALAHLEPLPHPRTRRRWRSGWSRRPSPTRCSSPTRAPRRSSARSRWRASTSTTPASRSGSASSPSRAPSTAARPRAIAAAGSEKMVKGFGPLLPGFTQVPFGDLEAVRAAIGPETAAILVEPIQGEGGIRALPREALRALRAICDEHGLAADPRRGPVRHGAHRPALRPRMGRDRARHHGGRQGHRRRLPARRLPRHRGARPPA